MTWWPVFLVLGCAAGLLAGLFGVGGGLIVVAALAVLAPQLGVPNEHIMHVSLATALAGIVFTSMSSGYAHAQRGAVLWPSVQHLLPGLMIGAALGAVLASSLKSEWLQITVGVFCWFAAWQTWKPKPILMDQPEAPQGNAVRLMGLVIGTLSALVGIGGGSFTVPYLIHRHAEPVRAVATSAVCGFPIALMSAIAYAALGWKVTGLPDHTLGFVYWPATLCIAIASMVCAPLGARLAHSLSGIALKRTFAVFLVVIGGMLLMEAV